MPAEAAYDPVQSRVALSHMDSDRNGGRMESVMKLFKMILKNETVFCVSFLLAVLSSFVVKPDMQYLGYPDYRTIALLFCLMIIVAGFQALGLFRMLGHFLITRAGSIRGLSVVMILLCFFSSMVITNDVTLITFVPFTILVMRMGGRVERVLKLVVLETIAANLGSMATPIGNPQNLYLYSVSDLTAAEFMQAVLPYAGLSLLLLMAVALIGKDEPLLDVSVEEEKGGAGKTAGRMLRGAAPLLILLLLCLLVVFRMLPYQPVLICVILVILVTVLVGGLFLAFDIFMFLCIYRKYEADSGSQRISHFCRAGKGTSDGNPYEPDHQQCSCCDPFVGILQ